MESGLTRAHISQIDPGESSKDKDMLEVESRSLVLLDPEHSDAIIYLDAENTRYDQNSGTLFLAQNNGIILKITGFPTVAELSEGGRGPRGAKGEDGTKGEDGADGRPGKQGCPGVRGSRGARGETGATGATGSTGPTGGVGPTGNTGATGPTGKDGGSGSITITEDILQHTISENGLTVVSGRHQQDGSSTVVSVLFPEALATDPKGFQLTFVDANSQQANEYVLIELTKGGFSLQVADTAPLANSWDFFWEVRTA